MTLKSFWARYGKILLVIAVVACLLPTLRRSAHEVARLPVPHLGWLLAASLLFLGHYLLQAFGWHGILRALGQPVSPRTSLRMWYMSLIARWMPGRVWYSATRLYLARKGGLSLTAVTFAIVMELIYILVSGVLATLLFAGGLFRGMLGTAHGGALAAAVGLVVLGGAALALRPSGLLQLCRFGLFRKAVKRLTGEELTAQNMPTMGTGPSLGLLAYYTVFWIYSGVMFGVLASAFVPMNGTRWLACIPAFAGSWLIGFFSIITPAGLGAREGAMWLMLKGVMPQAEAAVLAVASRVMMLLTELLSAGVCSLVLGRPELPPRPGAVPESAGTERAVPELAGAEPARREASFL